MSTYTIHKDRNFKFIEEGEGDEVLLLLHGLVGMLSNFETVIEFFSKKMKVVVPILPLYSLDIRYTSVSALQRFINRMIERRYKKVHILGNSLGGHIGLLQAIHHPETVKSLSLTGSSGLFESGLGDSYPRRHDYEYIRRQTEMVFYDPKIVTKELVDHAYNTVNNRMRALKTLYLAKSAIRHNLSEELHLVQCPSLLIWGENDLVTPKFVAEDFHRLIQGSELHLIDKCGHAPMMEHPDTFNQILEQFLQKHRWI